LLALILTLGQVFFSTPALAFSCASTTPPTIHAGDAVSAVVTLHTTDPNESGEGEPVSCTTSGGQVLGTVSTYEVPRPFQYTATTDGETVSCVFGGEAPDGDESFDIQYRTGFHVFNLTQAQKSALTQIAIYSGVTSGALWTISGLCGLCNGLIVTIPFCAPCAAITNLLAGIGALGAGGAALLACDPSDPNFTVIATPMSPSLTPLTAQPPLTQPMVDAFNALLTNEEQIVGVSGAILTSINRAQGAADAGNDFWQAQQMQAAQQYEGELALLLRSEVLWRSNLQNALLSDGFPRIQIAPFDVFVFELNILSGFPSSISTLLAQAGADAAEIEAIRQTIVATDVFAAAQAFPDLLTSSNLINALSTAADALAPPLDCSPAVASPARLWPPDHKLQPVSVQRVIDRNGDPVTITITDITQDEPLTGGGSGSTSSDATGVGTATAMLRSERAGTGDGRVYHLGFRADDGKGGQCTGTVKVCVPHDSRPGQDCVDQGRSCVQRDRRRSG
jgi:hypothetical protein